MANVRNLPHGVLRLRAKRLLVTSLVLLLVSLTPGASLAAAGAFDPTYSGDGVTTNTFGTGRHVAVDPQGRIVVGGKVQPGRVDAGRPSLMRYTSTGALDRTLDGDGRMSLPAAGSVRGLAIQNGNILVATQTALWRFLPGGAPDLAFGGDGRIDFPTGYSVTGRHPLWASTNRAYILLKQSSAEGDRLFSFATDGSSSASSPPAFLPIRLTSIAVHLGYVYAVGSVPDGNDAERVGVVRFSAGAQVRFDATYNGGRGVSWGPAIRYDEYGVVTSYEPNDIVIHPTSGTITVVGSKYECSGGDCSSYYHGFAVRLRLAGGLDGTFGEGGEARAGCTNGTIGMTSVALQGNKTIAAGQSADKWEDSIDRFGVTRLTASGAVDTTFSHDACYSLSDSTAGAVIEDMTFSGGKIVAVGGPYTARYLA